ncbi:long-chain-acyl-CoA synthetase [Vibrio sinensis]|uniref:Long-chain-acyl-CoA synthetase n=1 Tax=Vibrio sinensis TaxID=2302434 RepID=A0A3A6QJV5_9VIBR|nr:long-chain-acyl-CoA synthetase [Vibrio sinensis]RJX71465.1 long-chain-acyl-CoA synthetase [Vibrio sinensis]
MTDTISPKVDATYDEVADVILPVPRSETQEKMDRRAKAAMLIKPSDHYTLADRFEHQVSQRADQSFLIYNDRSLSYLEVDHQANKIAHTAYKLGLRAGDVCAIALENRPEFFFAWFGLAKIGATVAFINTQIHGTPLVHALEACNPKMVLVGEECASLFAKTMDQLTDLPLYLLPDSEKPATSEVNAQFDASFAHALEAASIESFDKSVRSAVTAEMPSLLIFTSGTTGLPKAAIYSHMRWMCSGDVMHVTLDAVPDDIFYCFLPLYHGAAATSITSTALAAGSSILLRRKFSVRSFWPDIKNNQVTVVQYIGEICRYLLNHDDANNQEQGYRDHQVRAMLGAGLTAESWRRWLDKFGSMDVYEGWGSTEANTNLINLDNYIGSCGRVPDKKKTNFLLVRYDVEADQYIKDDQGFCIPCQEGEVGEALGMIINHPDMGAGRFEGYTSAEASEQKIVRNVLKSDDAYWRSGDLLRYDQDDYYYFVDRIGDTYRWKSENVSTQEVATALEDFQGAETINIYGVLVPNHEGRAGMAAIVMQDGETFDPKAFFQLTEQRLPRYAAPQFVRVCGAADITTTFKLRKVDLQRQGYDPKACRDPLFIRNEEASTYESYSPDRLAAVGYPPFQHSEQG